MIHLSQMETLISINVCCDLKPRKIHRYVIQIREYEKLLKIKSIYLKIKHPQHNDDCWNIFFRSQMTLFFIINNSKQPRTHQTFVNKKLHIIFIY